MSEKLGVTIIGLEDQAKSASPAAWVTPVRLGWNADKTRVVDFYGTEAAWLFRPVGKSVTVEESARYGIGPDHPFSPRPPVLFVPTVDPDEEEGKGPRAETKQATVPEDKAVKRSDIEDKSVKPKRRKGK